MLATIYSCFYRIPLRVSGFLLLTEKYFHVCSTKNEVSGDFVMFCFGLEKVLIYDR